FSTINPTLNYSSGVIQKSPVPPPIENDIGRKCVELSKTDWDSFETSWDFKQHPLVRLRMAGAHAWGDKQPVMLLPSAYRAWKQECNGRFEKLKANEEEINRMFIDIYGLQDELTPEVADKVVTVHYLVDTKDDIPASLQGSNY